MAPFSFFVSALEEELFFRAYLWLRLTQLTGRPQLALVISAALFSAAHVYPWDWSLCLFIEAWVLGLIFWKRRSLWALVIGHWLFNLALVYM